MLTLTADSLPRFVTCNGSRGMPGIPEFQPDDTVRDEGNAVDWLAEQVFLKRFGTDELVNRQAPNGVWITGDMVDHVTPYLEAIRGTGAVQVVTSYGDGQRYQVNGRADHIYFDAAQYTLYVSDFKYGWGIIEPKDNWTLISHALGWMFANQGADVRQVVLRIFQPRPHHIEGKIRKKEYSTAEMWQFWNTLQLILLNPSNHLTTSEHCYKCPSLALCPAAQKAGLNALDVSEIAYVSNLDDGTLAFMLDQTDRAIKILEQLKKAFTDDALHRIKKGRIVPGYAVEKDWTQRQWKDGITLETARLMTGKDLSEKPKMLSPAQAEKLGISSEMMEALAAPREKGVKLSKASADQQVKKMFKNL